MSASSESQKLVTEATHELLEFDFTAIGGSAKVHIAQAHEELDYRDYTNPGEHPDSELIWVDGYSYVFTRMDFQMSGIRSDLTGAVAEPTLTVAAVSLWDLPEWQAGTRYGQPDQFGLMDYRGLRVRRQRLFFNTTTFIAPQVYYVKTVEDLTATRIKFTLTPSLGAERLDRPSARKLEI